MRQKPELRAFALIRDTQNDGAKRCIMGRSTYRPKIYCVCMGIRRQTISLENKFWTIYENLTGVKILGKRLFWPNLRDAAVLENVQSRFNFAYICL